MKRYLLILIAIGILFSFCSCSNGPKNAVSNGKAETNPPINSQKAKIPSYQIAKPTSSQLVSQDKAVTLENCTYQIKNVSVSKKLIGIKKDDVYYLSETTDDSGNLTSAHSYIYIDLTAKNLLGKEATVCFNSMQVVSISTDNGVNDRIAPELRFFDKSQHKNSNDSYNYKFRSNEATTFQLLFIISDAGLKTNLYFEVNPTGESDIYFDSKQYNPDVKRFIKLKVS